GGRRWGLLDGVCVIVYFVDPHRDWLCVFFFFNDTATTEIYTLSLHDALPIFHEALSAPPCSSCRQLRHQIFAEDRKSTRLNSSHRCISYAVFCLKKKKHTYERKGIRHENNIETLGRRQAK